MSDNRSVFERLNDIETVSKENNQMLAELLDAVKEDDENNLGQQLNENELFFNFLKRSKKSWRWFGSRKKFNRVKLTAIISLILVIVFGIISSVISTMCFKLYSTFTLFENIWVIFAIIMLVYVIHGKFIIETNDLANHSTQKYIRNDAGMMYPRKTKTSIKVFKWLAIISTLCNIWCVFLVGKGLQTLAVVFEILFLLAIFFSLYAVFMCHYNYLIAWVEGRNYQTGETITLVLMPGSKTFMTKEKFDEQFKKYL